MDTTFPGYTLNQSCIYSGQYAALFSGTRDADHMNVVIKILKHKLSSPENIARFKHEYEVARKFESKDYNDIVRVFSFEKKEEYYAIIMENINLPTLAEILEQREQIGIEDFLKLAISITKALGHIHQNDIIHKDLNPSNIMIDYPKKQIKIIDFSLSTELPKEHVKVTSTNFIEGTLAYLSPEQTGRMNRGIDYRTDFYSLGVIFYQMLTGQLPFISKDSLELIHAHIAIKPKAPHEINTNIPFIVSEIILKLLAKKAEDRYQNANGLITDLNQCLIQYKKTGKIERFVLGTKDVFSRFQIPEKLYGREKQVQIIMDAYERVAEGTVELMLVSGYSGIGKSSLVHEVHKPIIKKHGYFISGKFDQFKHNVPYNGIIQAFDDLFSQILTEPEEHIEYFRNIILEAVGKNGQIMIELIPSLKTIIGEQPPMPTLGSTERKNILSYVFMNFIRAIAAPEHPLVLFLDDLQWTDLSTLKILELLLTSTDCKYLFIIGSYRSNEVDTTHVLSLFLEEIQKRNAKYEKIDVGPLNQNEVEALLVDTLHQEQKEVEPLAAICFDKTAGNPFFLIQLLLDLYKEKLINFNIHKNQWIWDLSTLKKVHITDNVVELMISKLSRLAPVTQATLQYASCIGNQFELSLLSSICKKDTATLQIELQETLKEGYILSHGESYRASSWYFAHDRIQQAAHAMIDEQKRSTIHINLARLMLQDVKEKNLEEVVFSIADHYNIGLEGKLFDNISSEERRKIIEINLIASKTAKSAAAFDHALRYIEYALKYSSDKSWKTDYNLLFELNVEATDLAFLSSQFESMDKYAQIALINAQSIYDELKIIIIQINLYIAQAKLIMTVDTGKKILARLGLKLPEKPNKIHILLDTLKIKFLLFGKTIQNILDQPEMTSEQYKAIISLIRKIIPTAFRVNPELFALLICKAVILSLRFGNAKQSPIIFVLYGAFNCGVLGDIDKGSYFGELGLQLLEKNHQSIIDNGPAIFNDFIILHWKKPIADVIKTLLDDSERCFNYGEMEYAGYGVIFAIHYSFLSGVFLGDLLKKIEPYKIRIQNVRQIDSYNMISIFQQTILNLVEIKEQPGLLVGSGFNEHKMIPEYMQRMDKSLLFWIYFNKSMLFYLFDKYAEAEEAMQTCLLYEHAAYGFFTIPTLYLYKSLLGLARYPISTSREKKKIRKMVQESKNKMKKWAYYAPSNFTQKRILLEAEWENKINNNHARAAILYDQAINAAGQNEFINDKALANELGAKFYISLNQMNIATVYMEKARHCYRIWGANAKVEHLNKSYPELLSGTAGDNQINPRTELQSLTSWQGKSELLDIGSIQKFSQVISSTIILDELLKRLMRIVIENAGAQKSLLLLNKDGQYLIAVEGHIGKDEAKVAGSVEMSNEKTPISLINYVARTKKPVVLDDASSSEQFVNDAYIIKYQPRSILCMPLLNQGVCIGILYMENNLIEGAFTNDRINLLNLLSSQIAISIDNARLYSSTKELNEQLISINKSYERFVPQDFLTLLEKKSIMDVNLGDQIQKNVSVLFADIRNFTKLSEKISPQENFNFINTFLSLMGPIIRKHNGFVDKYIGDAIMALYPLCADDAVQCAIDMQQAIYSYNKEHKNNFPIHFGIGINTGSVMLGMVGESYRMNATVISDAVNIAARVESLTKEYKAQILITEETFKRLKNPARYKIELVNNQVVVKGKVKPITVYQVQQT